MKGVCLLSRHDSLINHLFHKQWILIRRVGCHSCGINQIHRIIKRIAIAVEVPRPALGKPHRIIAQEAPDRRIVVPRLGVGQARGGVADVAGASKSVALAINRSGGSIEGVEGHGSGRGCRRWRPGCAANPSEFTTRSSAITQLLS